MAVYKCYVGMKSDQALSFLQIWSYLLKKPSVKNFIFCAVEFSRCIYVSVYLCTTDESRSFTTSEIDLFVLCAILPIKN